MSASSVTAEFLKIQVTSNRRLLVARAMLCFKKNRSDFSQMSASQLRERIETRSTDCLYINEYVLPDSNYIYKREILGRNGQQSQVIF